MIRVTEQELPFINRCLEVRDVLIELGRAVTTRFTRESRLQAEFRWENRSLVTLTFRPDNTAFPECTVAEFPPNGFQKTVLHFEQWSAEIFKGALIESLDRELGRLILIRSEMELYRTAELLKVFSTLRPDLTEHLEAMIVYWAPQTKTQVESWIVKEGIKIFGPHNEMAGSGQFLRCVGLPETFLRLKRKTNLDIHFQK